MISCYKDRPRRVLEQECHSGKKVIKSLQTEMEVSFSGEIKFEQYTGQGRSKLRKRKKKS